jgi:hypothetical protein
MPSQEEIEGQLRLLATYRRNLNHLLQQQAQTGSANVPLNIINDIEDSRANIQRLKGILRTWGAIVEDHPDDGEVSTFPVLAHTQPASPPALPPPISPSTPNACIPLCDKQVRAPGSTSAIRPPAMTTKPRAKTPCANAPACCSF